MRPLVLALLLAAACGRSSSPAGTVRALVEATQAGDVDAVLARLGPRTRARLAADAKLVGQAGRRALDAKDLLAVGWTPPARAVASIEEVGRRGNEATVEITATDGSKERVELVREGGSWKIELP